MTPPLRGFPKGDCMSGGGSCAKKGGNLLDTIPSVAWTRRLDQKPDRSGRPSRMSDLRLFLQMLPVFFRMRAYARRQGRWDFDPLNAVSPPDPGPCQGVPLGGIGGGCIGRGWRGEFRRWTLRPGFPHQEIVWADQFTLYCQREGSAPQAQVLYPGHPEGGALSSWQWDLDGAGATYYALFPRAWTVYEEPLPGLRLTCRQLSPVIPGNYRESSFPCAHFAWRIENTAESAATVALMFTLQNGTGTENDRAGGHSNHPVNNWKDLNPKFVLQVYRDHVATGDAAFLAEVWPAVEEALAYVGRFDRDGDGLIENNGFPDQTYDAWAVSGPSAYTGGLWLAALQAGAAIADVLGKSAQAAMYRAVFEKGRAAYEERLWNGRYYNYDSSRSRQHDSIMADQLAGQWYARSCGLPAIVGPARARSALSTVFAYNVQRFQAGRMGAVNGMRPDGQVDRTSLQSREVWTGTTYALAAAMLWEGLDEEAWRTAEGVVRTTYETRGYWFQTPEAWDEHGDFRALAYMRPLSIWAIEWALRRRGR